MAEKTIDIIIGFQNKSKKKHELDLNRMEFSGNEVKPHKV